MDFISSQIRRHLPRHKKKRLTQDQVNILERSFASDKRIEPERKLQLANQLGVPPRQIAIWYQNKRARWKTQSLELDYGALQLRLENALAEKRKLEKDVERLKLELKKAQDMVLSLKESEPNISTCRSTSCVEESTKDVSCLQGDMNALWGNCEVLQLEELYACLMGANRSSFD